jgi:hypothetical protein
MGQGNTVSGSCLTVLEGNLHLTRQQNVCQEGSTLLGVSCIRSQGCHTLFFLSIGVVHVSVVFL